MTRRPAVPEGEDGLMTRLFVSRPRDRYELDCAPDDLPSSDDRLR